MLSLLVVTPSLLVPQLPLPHPQQMRAAVRLQATAEPEVVEAPPMSKDEELRSLAVEGSFAKLGESLESVGMEASELKSSLVGAWTLIAASDAEASVTGSAAKWKKGRGHFQVFKKPDPMAVFEGGDALFFMTTAEVVADVKAGSSTIVKVRGGFAAKAEGEVVESYTRRDVGGNMESDTARISNSWTCAYVSDKLRVCRLADGGLRVYDKVEEMEAEAALVALRAEPVAIDPKAAAEATVKKVKKPEVVDDRPAWQKRVDEADGIKRTANGTPIINHGPIA